MVDARRSNTILYTDRWSGTVTFYRDQLRLTVAFENDWFVEFALGPDSFVSIADAARSTIAAGNGAGVTLSLRVDDVAAARCELIAAGVDVTDIGMRWGADVCDVRDPSGNRLEFWAPRAARSSKQSA